MTAAVHMEALAIFGGLLINEAEDKIQYVKFRLKSSLQQSISCEFYYPQ